MALTERLDILINASGSKAIREFSLVGKAASTEMGKVDKAGTGLTGTLNKLGTTAKTGLAAGLAVGAGALVKFGADAVKVSSDLAEQQAATNTIFMKGASIVQDYAEQAAASIGVSRRAALEASNSFGDLFLNVGFTEKQAGRLSVGLVQLAGDLASFKNLGTDVVLEKLRSGIVGETEPLRSLGIVMNEATVKSKAMEMGLGGVGRELTDGEKIAARYAIIIDKTGKAQGDAARTADSLANKQRRLSAEWEDSKATLGDLLIPAVSAVTGELENLTGAQDKANGVTRFGLFAWRDSSSTLGKFKDVLIGFKKESVDTARTQDLLAQAERDLGMAAGSLASKTMDLGKAQELAAAAAEEHAKQIDRQNAAMLSALGAELNYERSLNSLEDASIDVIKAQQELAAAIKDHGRGSVEARVAAEELSRAQLGLRGDVLSASEAFAAQAEKQAIANGKQWTAVDAARAQIAGLEDMKRKYPELRAEIDQYIVKLLSIPGVIDTRVSLETGRTQPADSAGHRVKRYATGGMVDGPIGAPQLAVVHGGERVLTPAQQRMAAPGGGANPTTVNIYMPPGSDGQDVVNAIERYERRNGAGWRSAS